MADGCICMTTRGCSPGLAVLSALPLAAGRLGPKKIEVTELGVREFRSDGVGGIGLETHKTKRRLKHSGTDSKREKKEQNFCSFFF